MANIQVTLNIPSKLYERAKAVAELTQRQVTEVLADSIVLNDVNENTGPDDEALVRERTAYIELHPHLLENYAGEYVAIYGGQMVDHDVDDVALSLRIYQRFPNDFVWIAPVQAQPIEEWVVRSPRFESLVN